MTYLRQYWADGKGGSTPISADALNYMEAGISAARVDWNVRTVTATTTAAVDDYILVDTTSAAVTITAPAPAAGQVFAVKWIAGTPAPTLSGTFNSGAPVFVAVDQAVEFISDGTKWYRQVRPAAANLADWSQIYGKANGVASLDSTGNVPAAQLGNAPQPLAAYLTVGYQIVATTSGTAVTGLQVDGIGVGLYLVELIGDAFQASTANVNYCRIVAVNGLVAANSPVVGYATPATSSTSGFFGYSYASTSATMYSSYSSWTQPSLGAMVFQSGVAGVAPFNGRGMLRVTTAGSLRVEAWSNASNTGWIDAGTVLRATKIG